jgi:DNA topoisomerase I
MVNIASPKLSAEPAEFARSAGLQYVSDSTAGIRRTGRPGHFRYVLPHGSLIRDSATLGRIKRLAIPPAWTDVWICARDTGHLQAVGKDARGRKQYRYHPRWREVRDEAKFGRMLAFAKVLPSLRKRVNADLQRNGMPREKVLAAVVNLLEATLIRVGNDEYAQKNRSYGLTTLRNGHARVRGGRVVFDFIGKAGIRHRVDVEDPRLARVVRRCQELPGQELFGYVDETGKVRDVASEDVNSYLKQITGEDFTAKDFRTWAGTVLAALALREFEPFNSHREAKRNVTRAIEAVAKMLGNTPAVCRKCYVHPEILQSYLDGKTMKTFKARAEQRIAASLHKLKPEEAAVMMLLRERLRIASKQTSRAAGQSMWALPKRRTKGGARKR